MTSRNVIVLVSVVAVVALAATVYLMWPHSSEPEEDNPDKYMFTMYETGIGKNVTVPAFYNDSYFDKPSTEFNQQLLDFALCLQFSSGIDVKDPVEKSKSVLKLLSEIGCSQLYVNPDFYQKSSLNSLDVAIGAKRCGDTTLIFVVPNGTHYSSQFASNLELGMFGSHQGFAKASQRIYATLLDFVEDLYIPGDVKLLMTGYSRSSAAVNLLGSYICNSIENGSVKDFIGLDLKQEDFYCFGFEVPFCGYYEERPDSKVPSPTDPRYDNIWYTVNPADVVTYVPPEEYTFVRYGQMITLPSDDAEKKAKMVRGAEKLFSSETASIIDLPEFNTQASGILDTPAKMITKIKDQFFNAVGSRVYYSSNIEGYLVPTVYAMREHPGMFEDMIEEIGYVKLILTILPKCGTDELDGLMRPALTEVGKKYGYEGEDLDLMVTRAINATDQIGQALKRYFDGDIRKLLDDEALQVLILNYRYPITSHYPAMAMCYIVQDDPNYAKYFE